MPDPPDYEADAHTLFERCYADAIDRLAAEYVEALYPEHLQLRIAYADLEAVSEALAQLALRNLEAAHDALESALATYDDRPLGQATVRVIKLPETATHTVGEARKGDIERLIGLSGQVTKRTEVQPKLDVGVFQCYECGTETRLEQGFGAIREPFMCDGCGNKTAAFQLLKSRSEWVDHQLIQLQQPPEDARGGQAASITIHLEEGLTDRVESGDRVTINGEWVPYSPTGSTRHETLLEGHSIELEETLSNDLDDVTDADATAEIRRLAESDDPYGEVVASIAPSHKGDVHLKEAIALQLFGGWRRTDDTGAFHRGSIHMLWVGDPGTGKTGLMEAAEELAPRSAITDGTGSSEAGLTASMTKDDFGDGDEWTIAAGTIVRASGGLAVVDEIDKGDVSDLDALHTALESQQVLVSKAGRHARLDANTSLLAAGNPTGGHFDPTAPFVEQIELKSPLLSRFDLIFTVREKVDEELVADVSRHMVDSRSAAGKKALGLELTAAEQATVDGGHDPATIRRWIAYAREHCQPIPTEAAKDRMVEFYTDLKITLPERYSGAEGDDYDGPPLPVTARKQMALFRLAEASARIRLSEEITVADVERVIPKIERSLADIGIAPDAAALGETSADLDLSEIGV